MMPPHVLVTGFSIFPGTAVNPTEALVMALAERGASLAQSCQLTTEVFDVDYRALPNRLSSLGQAGCPDIAIHFGLSAKARGFALERIAKNVIGRDKSDNAGHIPEAACILDAGEPLTTSLPVDAILDALRAKGLPADYSDDAGDYLCNFLFYNSRGGLCSGFAPKMSGFVHVPPLAGQGGMMTLSELVLGAETILKTCCWEWASRMGNRKSGRVVPGERSETRDPFRDMAARSRAPDSN